MVSKVGFVSQILKFLKRSSRSIIRVSSSVDQDQDRHYDKSVIFVSPSLSPKCRQGIKRQHEKSLVCCL